MAYRAYMSRFRLVLTGLLLAALLPAVSAIPGPASAATSTVPRVGELLGVPGRQLVEPGRLDDAGARTQRPVALAHVDGAEPASGLRPVVR